MKTKKIIFSSLALLLASSLIASYFIIKSNKTNDEIETQVQENGIKIKRISSIENGDGSLIQTFSFSVKPDDATSDLVKVEVTYVDGTSCNEVVQASVDNDENTITLICLKAFSKQVILTVTALSDTRVKANVSIDYLQRWPIATSKYEDNIEEAWYIGNEYCNEEDIEGYKIKNFSNGVVNFSELFDFDYGIFSKEKGYYYDGISSDVICTGNVIDYSNTLTVDMKKQMVNAAKSLLFKMGNMNLSWSKELIWNLIDSNEYKKALYNAMLTYDHEDNYSRIELTCSDFVIQYNDGDGNVEGIGMIDKIKFIIDITADYSSLTTPVDTLTLQKDSILF